MNAERWITAESLVYGPRLGEISALGTSGRWLVFTMTRFNEDRKSIGDLFLHDSTTGHTEQITRNGPGVSVSCPTLVSIYHPDGEADFLFFIRSGKIWAIPLHGGEAYVVWEESLPVNSFHVGGPVQQKFIVAEFTVPVHTATPFAPQPQTEEGSGIMFNQLMVRYWTEWNGHHKHNHLFLGYLSTDPQGCLQAERPAFDLFYQQETDCPPKSPAGHGRADYSLSPDGRWIVAAYRKPLSDGHQPRDMAWTTDIPISLASLKEVDMSLSPQDSGYHRLPWQVISDPSLHSAHCQPVFSPNSEYIAFLSMREAGYESDRNRIVVYHLPTQARHVLTEDTDLSFQSLLWSEEEDGHVLYASAHIHASLRLMRFSLDAENKRVCEMRLLRGDESRTAHAVLRNDLGGVFLYLLESTLLSPTVLKRVSLTPQTRFSQVFPLWSSTRFASPLSSLSSDCEEVPLTTLDESLSQVLVDPHPGYSNGDLLLPELSQLYYYHARETGEREEEGSSAAPPPPLHAWYLSPLLVGEDAETDDVFALRPTTCMAEGSVPLLVFLHGGPQSAWANTWSLRWNLAFWASQGYAVLAVHFTGSVGFGSDFQNAIRHDWGGAPLRDVLRGVDVVLSRYPYLHRHRLAALGGSYGGYLTYWLQGQIPRIPDRRFSCLVAHAGIFSLAEEYYTTEEVFFPERDLGRPWERGGGGGGGGEVYERWCPSRHVNAWQTPTLVVQGGRDYRVPETQALAAFTALQRRGVPAQLLYFPDEGHWVLQPKNSLQWHREVAAWLKKWLVEG